MIVLVHSSENDAVSSAIRNRYGRSETKEFASVSLQDLMGPVGIFDSLVNGVPTVRWTLPGGKIIRNDECTYLVNRAQSVPESLFSGFAEPDRFYARREFEAYLAFALGSFKKKSAKASPLGLGGQYYSLPSQWIKIARSGLGLNLPSYYLGPMASCPFDRKSKDLVLSDLYAYFNWRPVLPEQLASRSTCSAEPVFVFRRPKGMPCFAFVAGKEVCTPDSDVFRGEDGRSLKASLVECSRQIASLFGYAFAEILYFVEGRSLTFGTITMDPVMTHECGDFDETVIQGLEGMMEEESLWS